MSVYTKFKIVEFGERTTVKVNGFDAVLDTWYDAADALTFHKTNPDLYGEPFDFVKYQTTDDTLTSNVSVITVNVPPDKTIDPASADNELPIANDTEYGIMAMIPFNAAVDRVKILDFDNSVGQLVFEGNNVFPGFEILHYDFESLLFKSKKGTGDPYQEIIYQVGNADGYDATEYSLKLDISGLAVLESISEDTVDEDGITTITSGIKITNGRVNGTAKINVEVNLSPSAWPVDTENFFNLSYNGDDIENNVNFTQDIDVDLNNEGFENLFAQLNINDADLPVTGTITFTLIDINGDTGLVDPMNATIIITI